MMAVARLIMDITSEDRLVEFAMSPGQTCVNLGKVNFCLCH